MFTLLRGTLLKPLPHRNGEQLLYLRQSALGAGQSDVNFSIPELADYREASRTVADFAEYSSSLPFTMVGRDGEPVRIRAGIVSGNFFNVLGLTAALGRLTSPGDDGPAAPSVSVLSHDFWRERFGGDSAVVGSEWRTVVGVVGDTRDAGLERAPAAVMFVVRTTTDPATLQPTIARAIREVEPRQLIERMSTLEAVRDTTVAPRRLNAFFIAAFAALALVIATVGITGVLAFSVRARTAEIGIRMSLGADAARVQRMVLGEGGVLLATGVGVGLTGALLAARLLRGLLFGVTPYDPLTLAAVAAVLSAVGVGACWIPALRAARVDPAVALRAD